MTFPRQIALLALSAFLGLVLTGCQPSDPDSPKVAKVTSIAVTPDPVNMEIGGVRSLTVTGTFSDSSNFVVNFGTTFVSSAPAVATVTSDTGYVTAVGAGNATITATHTDSGSTATTTVSVSPLRVLSIAVSPASSTLAPGATAALTVTATYNNLTTGPVTSGSTFLSSAPAVATVDAAGVVTAIADGTATITATHTASGKTGTATVTVSAGGGGGGGGGGFTNITFDSAGLAYLLTGFGGAEDSTLVPDPTAGSNIVAKVVKSATAELWAGTTVSTDANQSVGKIPFTSTSTKMTVRVYSPRAGIPVRLKVEDAADNTRSVETEALTTKVNTWETLTFDFASQASGTAALNLAYTYNKVSIFFDFGKTGALGGAGTFYFDDVAFATGGPSGNTGTCTAPNCTDFSGGGISFSPFENPGGGTVELAKDPNDAANDVVKFVKKTGDNDFFGTTISGLAGPATLTSASKIVTLRVYSPAVGTNFLLKLEGGPGGAVVEKDVVTTVAGAWETLSFDLSAGAAGTYTTVVIFPNGRSKVTADKTMYIDELKFPASVAGPGSGSTGTCTGTACIDFSEAGIGFGPFENGGGGTVAIVNDPNDATNKVVQFVKKPGDGDFFGTTITGLGGSVVLTPTEKTVTMRVYSPVAGTNFLLKFEGGTGGPAVTEKDAATTLAGAWETLSFVMPDAGTYTTVVLFPNGRSSVTADKTMLVDELRFPAISTGGGGGGGSSFTPITFDSTTLTYTLTGFGGAEGAPVVDPTNASNNVARVVKSATAELWAGVTVSTGANFSVDTIPFTATSTQMTVRVWSPRAGIPVRLKVEDAADPTRSVETEAVTTVANAWETLTFNFANQAAGTAALNLAFTYNKVSIFFDFGKTGADGGGGTFYFDDVTFVSGGGGGGGGGGGSSFTPITFDSTTLTYTLTGFGGAEGATLVDPTNASNNVARVVKSATAELWAGVTVSTGANFSVDKIPFTATSTQMTVRVYSPRAGIPVRLKVEDAADPTRSVETEALTTQVNTWETLTFNFANQAAGTAALNLAFNYNKASIFFDFGRTGADGGGGTFYFDDVTFQ